MSVRSSLFFVHLCDLQLCAETGRRGVGISGSARVLIDHIAAVHGGRFECVEHVLQVSERRPAGRLHATRRAEKISNAEQIIEALIIRAHLVVPAFAAYLVEVVWAVDAVWRLDAGPLDGRAVRVVGKHMIVEEQADVKIAHAFVSAINERLVCCE